MANTIGINSKSCGRRLLQMSNGLTDVFVNVLVLSGSALAKTVSEKRLIVWLAESDPSDPVMSGFPRCSRHQTLLSIFGCHICNN